ncbi:RES family NAD+ phosphorylase [Paenibacillus silagei]|uniref:RES domain-containing protein n=1 Tax=Paenibacillus silagei TaxID=1670801 RepID=A0ABS4NXM3_9BACL|nr:RES family NAD+ phosphorylase [Paenibacillus silagei]MBP2114814.1 RES domain-containing protein [Paenibacillus silagei]
MKDKLEYFHLVFAEEFDSIFSAEIICCEKCVVEFMKCWPGVYLNDRDFHSYSIQISSLYFMMRFCDFITEDEFKKFSSDLVCPRCDQKLDGVIYPYNMPFNVPYGFEQLIEEITNIAYETPFLLLAHPFANEVFQEISYISQTVEARVLPDIVYRARIFNNAINYTVTDFFASPKEKIVEGRYNHAGQQVLYLSQEPETCFHELRSPKEGVIIAGLRINKPIKVLDLTMQTHDSDIIKIIRWSSLMNSPNGGDGWHKPHYVFTRFISDCAKSLGFNAIKYPSVRFNEGVNLALISYSENFKKIQFDEMFFFNASDTKLEELKKILSRDIL